jgi:SWI/SNF-related matrix-associated actin-dependent regulator of chromatin subfamily A member 5
MARKSSGRDSDGPSTADVSAHEDVEMQDQDDKMNGFKKFGVSASSPSCARPPFGR